MSKSAKQFGEASTRFDEAILERLAYARRLLYVHDVLTERESRLIDNRIQRRCKRAKKALGETPCSSD